MTDAGDVERFRWRPDPDAPRAANAAAVADRARQVAERVAAADGRVLVLGGDCTVGVGTVAGLALRGARPGLVYFDRHADLNVPDSTIDGALDWMGVAHMLDVDGCTDGLAGVGGARPLLEPGPARLPRPRPRSARRSRRVVDALRPAVVTLERGDRGARSSRPAKRSRRSTAATSSPCTSTSTCSTSSTPPLAENTDRAPGVPLTAAGAILATLLADPRASALTITELNPHHGAADGSTVRRLVEVVAAAYAVNGGH